MSFFKKFTHFVMGFRNIFYRSYVYNFLNSSILYFLALRSFRFKNVHNKFQRSIAPPSIPTLTNASTGSIFLIPICETLMLLGKFQLGDSTSFHHMSGLEYIRIMATNFSASPGPFRSPHFWFFIPNVAQISILHNMCDFI